MPITPVDENQAKEEVRTAYEKIKRALDLPNLPLFFTYLGGFSEYLSYLTGQLVPILENPKFSSLIQESEEKIFSLIKSSLVKSEEINEWLERYKNSPSFYNFQKDLEKIFIVNIKLAFLFIALREALKGWAVAAKQLPGENLPPKSTTDSFTRENNFVYEDIMSMVPASTNEIKSGSIQKQTTALEKDLLPRYLFLCRQEFNQLLKKEEFLIMRVGIEKLILSSLPLLPEKIESPINIFFKLTEKYRDFPELLYLICEHFPTLAVQKMLFSGFMKYE